jgi:predicted transcriptional regulator
VEEPVSKIQAETPITLEQEIVAALADADVTSNNLSALIERTEAAIPETDQAAETARSMALDPALSPDPKAARAAMEDAAFTRDRLKTLLPRLQARYQEVQAQEYLTQWRSDYEKLKVKRDGLAEELRTIYPEFETKIANLFTRIVANDAELSGLHQARPGGVALHLLGAELVARDLERFKATEPSITQELKLPTFAPGQRLAWPPPQPALAVMVAQSMVRTHDPHYTADWAAELEKDNARRAANEKRWGEEEAARQAESKRQYEASLRR